MRLNKNFDLLKDNYLFAEVENRVAAYKAAHPDKDIIKLGIGDVTLPLCSVVVDAGMRAAHEMGEQETFHGYGPYRGYTFLTQAIVAYYVERGIKIKESEVFVSDGAKSDIGNFLDLFDENCVVSVPDPVYPVYVDTNLMQGRKIVYANATRENDFLPLPDESVKADLIYICSPNNPTGAVYDRERLKKWVDYARVRRGDSVRRGVRIFCVRPRTAALYLRNPRRRPLRGGILFVEQNGGLHGHALRLLYRAAQAG